MKTLSDVQTLIDAAEFLSMWAITRKAPPKPHPDTRCSPSETGPSVHETAMDTVAITTKTPTTKRQTDKKACVREAVVFPQLCR